MLARVAATLLLVLFFAFLINSLGVEAAPAAVPTPRWWTPVPAVPPTATPTAVPTQEPPPTEARPTVPPPPLPRPEPAEPAEPAEPEPPPEQAASPAERSRAVVSRAARLIIWCPPDRPCASHSAISTHATRVAAPQGRRRRFPPLRVLIRIARVGRHLRPCRRGWGDETGCGPFASQ